MAIAHTVRIGLMSPGKIGYYGAEKHSDLKAAFEAAASSSCLNAAIVVRDYATGRRYSHAETTGQLRELENLSLWSIRVRDAIETLGPEAVEKVTAYLRKNLNYDTGATQVAGAQISNV